MPDTNRNRLLNMLDRRLILISLSLIGWLSQYSFASQPIPPLIRQLGDAEFEQRIAAEQEILRQGTAGLELLEAGASSSDPEVRQRSLRLLGLLRKAAFVEQRERIQEDPWTVSPNLAPAWEEFHRLAGDSPAARRLYVQMIVHESDLMLSVAMYPDRWQSEFERRCADLRTFVDRHSLRDLEPASVLALLFLADHPDNHINPLSAQCISSLISSAEFFNYVDKAPDAESLVCRALLSEWVSRSGHSTAPVRLDLATKYHLPAGLVAAREIIGNRNAVGASRTQLQNAIRFMAAFGGPDAISDLESLLRMSLVEIPTQVGPGVTPVNPPQPAEAPSQLDQLMNDFALLGLLQLTDQDPQEYGFTNVRLDLQHRFNPNTPSFSNDDDRRRALLRWKAWRLSHPLMFQDAPWDASEGWSM